MYQKQIVEDELKLDLFVLDGYRQVKVILSHLLHKSKTEEKSNTSLKTHAEIVGVSF